MSNTQPPKPIYLHWQHPVEDKSFKMKLQTLYDKPLDERNEWLKAHYHWKVSCLCQSKEPIPLVLSQTGERKGKESTYYLKNKEGWQTHHHPHCPFFEEVLCKDTPNQWVESEQHRLVMAIQGFQKPQQGISSKETTLQPHTSATFKKSLQTFATQWHLNSLSLAIFSRLNHKKQPPNWKDLYYYHQVLLKKMDHASPFKGKTLALHDFYLKAPQAKDFKERTAELIVRYGEGVEHYPFLIDGRVLSFETLPDQRYKDYYLIKLQTQLKGGISYLLLSKAVTQSLCNGNPLLTSGAIPSDRVIWLTGFLPQTAILKPVSIPLKDKTIKLSIPVCSRFTLIPLALNGCVVSHRAQLTCFNNAYQQSYFIKQPALSDRFQPISNPHPLTFYWLNPKEKGRQRYIPAHISTPKQKEPHYLQELQTQKPFWHWDLKTNPHSPKPPFSTKK